MSIEKNMNHKCRLLKVLIRYAVLSSVTALLFAQDTTVKPQPEIHVISSRPEFVSGGSTLIEVKASTASGWRVSVNGTDETARFRPANEASRYRAVITGLKSGPNTVQLEQQGTVVSTMKIDNHPTTGPLFSGPHQQPFVCQTEASDLGPATDADCDVPTIVNYYYKSTDALPPLYTIEKASALGPGFKTYDPSAPPPVHIAETRTSDGQTMPFIVRRETGVINRAAYDIEFLYQPGQSLPSPWERPNTGWNGRLVYLVGGGAAPGYLQGTLGDTGHLLARRIIHQIGGIADHEHVRVIRQGAVRQHLRAPARS